MVSLVVVQIEWEKSSAFEARLGIRFSEDYIESLALVPVLSKICALRLATPKTFKIAEPNP